MVEFRFIWSEGKWVVNIYKDGVWQEMKEWYIIDEDVVHFMENYR